MSDLVLLTLGNGTIIRCTDLETPRQKQSRIKKRKV